MLTVPVYVPSYHLSGDTHVAAVGDRVSWELAVAEGYLPDNLLATLSATAEPQEPPYVPGGWYPTLLRQGALTAWWNPGRPISGDIELRAWFWIGDSRVPEEGVPETKGTIRQLYWALRLLRQRPEGPWDVVPGIGLHEVESTQIDSVASFTAYFPAAGVDENDGHWQHSGWIAMLECDDDRPPPR